MQLANMQDIGGCRAVLGSIDEVRRVQRRLSRNITVERLGGRLGEDLKSGYGPQPVLVLLEGIAEAMAIEEEGGVVGQEALDRLSASRQAAAPFLGGGH
jgi:hypothetical protein